MFKKHQSLVNHNKRYIDVKEIYERENEVFFNFLGYHPNLNKKFLSPFRKDKRAGCYFKYKYNKLFFVDNKGFNGKIFFDCISLVQTLFPGIDYYNILELIADRTNLERKTIDFKQLKEYHNSYVPEIRFKYQKWDNNSWFYKEHEICSTYLERQPCYSVQKYWTNSREDRLLRKNKYGFPAIAYYFKDTNHTKLYFPESSTIKWFSTCNNEDLFGFHRINDYLFNRKALIITKSAKEDLILNFHYNANTVALQSETIPIKKDNIFKALPHKLLKILPEFKEVFVWFDNDATGHKNGKILTSFISNQFNKQVTQIFHNTYNDVGDIHKHDKQYLSWLMKNTIR